MEPAPAKVEKKPWTICPECGIGKGADHKRDCSKGKRPIITSTSTTSDKITRRV